MTAQRLQDPNELDAQAAKFYREAMRSLIDAKLPFLVGGGYALWRQAGISRCTKDLDLFVLPEQVEAIFAEMSRRGFEVELPYPHWLGKVKRGDDVIDLIYSSGNGLCRVDASWFEFALPGELLDLPVLCAPAEEMIWQKSFIMERHRFDGADVIHLLSSRGDALDWHRLLARFGDHWRVLLAHLVMFQFVYPDALTEGGVRLLNELSARSIAENRARSLSSEQATNKEQAICRGTFLSLLEYRQAIDEWGYRDARLPPTGTMSAPEIEHWTNTFER